MSGIITFLSDFGKKDWFVSAVKGEILKINPLVRIVDITHDLKPFDTKEAAFVLKMVYKNFPLGTINLAVVDPGVGSERKPLIIFSDGYYFVGPDNGIFSYIYKRPQVFEIIVKGDVSSTFHARDIFAPITAEISLGKELNKLGKRINNFVRFPFPVIKKKGNKIFGEIVYIDHFGNLFTNIPIKFLLNRVYLKDGMIIKIKKFYAQAKDNEVFAIKGSSGFYEIAGYKTRADERLKLIVGDKVIGEI